MLSKEIETMLTDFNEISKKKICVQFAITCAEKHIPIFLQQFPDDNRPSRAIEMSKEWLKNPDMSLSTFYTISFDTMSASKNARDISRYSFQNFLTLREEGLIPAYEAGINDAASCAANVASGAASIVAALDVKMYSSSASYASVNAVKTAYAVAGANFFHNSEIVLNEETSNQAREIAHTASNEEKIWQQQLFSRIIKSYKRSQLYAMINKDNTIVGNLDPYMLKTIFKYI